jgi:broad specificity phosphatase PhoE
LIAVSNLGMVVIITTWYQQQHPPLYSDWSHKAINKQQPFLAMLNSTTLSSTSEMATTTSPTTITMLNDSFHPLAHSTSSSSMLPSSDHGHDTSRSSYGELIRLDDDSDDEEGNSVLKNTTNKIRCNCPSIEDEQQVLLYLIRHGEAEHNIEEKKAMKEARRVAIVEDGLSEDDPKVHVRIEEARKAVLNDEMLRDAKLSYQGKKEAEQARDNLRKLIRDDKNLENPDYILVSPLTRTLETCNIIFPDNKNIHVRDELSERRTGKPPDTRSSALRLSLRPSFQRFSMQKLQDAAVNARCNDRQKARFARRCSWDEEDEPCKKRQETIKMTQFRSHQEIFLKSDDVSNDNNQNVAECTEEDKAELRARTESLFALLCDANSFSVAVVTHKGYLRELERGPFGNPEATEFQNCEIRVYRITLRQNKLVRAERVHVELNRHNDTKE